MGATEVDSEVFLAKPSGEDTALVVFSASAAKPGQFHLLPLLDDLPGYSKLYVRDPRVGWYNAGLPGVGETLAEIVEGIESEVAQLGATRIVTTGPSVGAYAATLFGCLLGAEQVIALAPQTLLDQGLRHAPPADIELQAPDLVPIVREAPGTRVDLVAGWNDHIDVFHARRIAGLPSVRVLAVSYRLHRFGRSFSRGGRRRLIAELLAGRTPEICTVDPELDPDSDRRIAAAVYAMERGDWQTVAASIAPVVERYPEWGGPRFDLGRSLVGMGDWPGAERAFVDLLQSHPDWVQPREELIELLLERDRGEEAEEVTREGLVDDPDWAMGHLLLARCLYRSGRVAEGRSFALRAAELHPKLAADVDALVGESAAG